MYILCSNIEQGFHQRQFGLGYYPAAEHWSDGEPLSDMKPIKRYPLVYSLQHAVETIKTGLKP